MKTKMKTHFISSIIFLVILGSLGARAEYISVRKCDGTSDDDASDESFGGGEYTIPLDACVQPLYEGFRANFWSTSMRATMTGTPSSRTVELSMFTDDNLKQAICKGDSAPETFTCECDACCKFMPVGQEEHNLFINFTQSTQLDTVRHFYYSDSACSTLIGEDTYVVGCNGGRGFDSAGWSNSATKIVVWDKNNTVGWTQYEDSRDCVRETGRTTFKPPEVELDFQCEIGACCLHSGEDSNHPFVDGGNLYVKFEKPEKGPSSDRSASSLFKQTSMLWCVLLLAASYHWM